MVVGSLEKIATGFPLSSSCSSNALELNERRSEQHSLLCFERTGVDAIETSSSLSLSMINPNGDNGRLSSRYGHKLCICQLGSTSEFSVLPQCTKDEFLGCRKGYVLVRLVLTTEYRDFPFGGQIEMSSTPPFASLAPVERFASHRRPLLLDAVPNLFHCRCDQLQS